MAVINAELYSVVLFWLHVVHLMQMESDVKGPF